MLCFLEETKLYMHVQGWSAGDRRSADGGSQVDLTSAIASVDKQEVYHFQSSLILYVEQYLSYELAQSFSIQKCSPLDSAIRISLGELLFFRNHCRVTGLYVV